MSSRLPFNVEATTPNSRARATRFTTLHGEVKTPVFMPVGTHATVRGQTGEYLSSLGFPVLLGNTYHLLLRPGVEVFRKFGGIHRFMSWPNAVLTDSGGYQLFSLSSMREINEEGASFTSYLSGKRVNLSPEVSIDTQKAIGSDIMMVLDHCIDATSDRATTEKSLLLTHRWAQRSLVARGDSPQALFAIVQGACFPDLRKLSATTLTQFDFDGFAVGGLAVGESKTQREDMTECTVEYLPHDRPRYLMGVGTPIDLLEAVHRGIDMFDCILPTSLSARGTAFTSQGKVMLRRKVYRFLDRPLDPRCECSTCAKYSRAYLCHLVNVGEPLATQLISAHNLYFYQSLMARFREHVLAESFHSLYQTLRPILGQSDIEFPVSPPHRNKKHPSPVKGNFEIFAGSMQSLRVRHRPSGEVMHSVNDPLDEARRLYLDQSEIAESLRKPDNAPIVVWDVGLGAAYNAMATVALVESADTQNRPVHLFSFENDLDALKLVLRHASRFPHLHHPAPSTLLKEGLWVSNEKHLSWRLIEGDFFSTLAQAPPPTFIFFDPFSSKTNQELWQPAVFEKILRHAEGTTAQLFTYTNSTWVRASLLSVGFFVAKGVGIGPKSETTIAATPQAATTTARHWLSHEWLKRWRRSQAPYPSTLSSSDREEFVEKIENHTQFRSDFISSARPHPLPAQSFENRRDDVVFVPIA